MTQICILGGKGDVIALEDILLFHELISSDSGRMRKAVTILH